MCRWTLLGVQARVSSPTATFAASLSTFSYASIAKVPFESKVEGIPRGIFRLQPHLVGFDGISLHILKFLPSRSKRIQSGFTKKPIESAALPPRFPVPFFGYPLALRVDTSRDENPS